MAILYGFAARCLFDVVFLHKAKQCRWLCAVSIHHESANSLRPEWGQSVIFSQRHGYCDVLFMGKVFERFGSGNLTCAREPPWLRVTRGTWTFYIRSSNWIIPNIAHAQSVHCLRTGRSIFGHAILITRTHALSSRFLGAHQIAQCQKR